MVRGIFYVVVKSIDGLAQYTGTVLAENKEQAEQKALKHARKAFPKAAELQVARCELKA